MNETAIVDTLRLHCRCGRTYVCTLELIDCRHGVEPPPRRRRAAAPRRKRKATA